MQDEKSNGSTIPPVLAYMQGYAERGLTTVS